MPTGRPKTGRPKTFEPEALTRIIADLFEASGVPAEEAGIVAAHLVEAEACGVTSHGLIRVPQYIKAIEEGKIVPGARVTVVSETVSTAVLDGHQGFGQVLARRAIEIALDKAGQTGVGAVTLFHCNHTGRLASYTTMAARRGMALMMMINAGGHGQWVSPYGGTQGRLATNPMSIAIPTGTDEPIVLDMATSAVAEGKIRAMMATGQTLPEGWVIDHQGRPTTNPADLYGPPRGALLPFGDHKGFGLAMIIDALAGGLSGAGCCSDPNAPLEGGNDGVFVLAIRIDAFCPLADFHERVRQLVRHVKSSPPRPGFAEVLVPGELEAKVKLQNLQKGRIPIDETVWSAIQPILDRFSLTVDRPERDP